MGEQEPERRSAGRPQEGVREATHAPDLSGASACSYGDCPGLYLVSARRVPPAYLRHTRPAPIFPSPLKEQTMPRVNLGLQSVRPAVVPDAPPPKSLLSVLPREATASLPLSQRFLPYARLICCKVHTHCLHNHIKTDNETR